MATANLKRKCRKPQLSKFVSYKAAKSYSDDVETKIFSSTGSFCSSCAIPPRVAGGLWSDGVGCDVCCVLLPLWGATTATVRVVGS